MAVAQRDSASIVTGSVPEESKHEDDRSRLGERLRRFRRRHGKRRRRYLPAKISVALGTLRSSAAGEVMLLHSSYEQQEMCLKTGLVSLAKSMY